VRQNLVFAQANRGFAYLFDPMGHWKKGSHRLRRPDRDGQIHRYFGARETRAWIYIHDGQHGFRASAKLVHPGMTSTSASPPSVRYVGDHRFDLAHHHIRRGVLPM
jgi:hypothetical protein